MVEGRIKVDVCIDEVAVPVAGISAPGMNGFKWDNDIKIQAGVLVNILDHAGYSKSPFPVKDERLPHRIFVPEILFCLLPGKYNGIGIFQG